MIERKLLKYIFIFLGFIIGLALALLDRWLDAHHRSFIFSWSMVILFFMIAGQVIGNLLVKTLNTLKKKEESISEQKITMLELSRLQSEMARFERLNLVGQLAAGLAHEIRNPLTIVRGYLQFLGTMSELQPHNAKFDLMIQELDRSNVIITEFLSFVKDSSDEMISQNLNDILLHLYPLLEADAFSQNKYLLFQPITVPDIIVNAKAITQLVLNLCRNGFEAMNDQGTLIIQTYLEDDHVVLTVKDEGVGILLEDLKKLGTPFFTTKENGTGLGIVTCYRIAEIHKAKIKVESDSSGTKFFVYFPFSEFNCVS